jgi:hypothetical protein
MGLYEQLVEALPELTLEDFAPGGSIVLQDDSDGQGPYIAKWDYEQPIPDGFALGK